MAEENQVQQEPQQVTTEEPQQVTTKEPQRVTMKDPKKAVVGKMLAADNCKRREAKKVKSEGPSRGVSQYYGIGFSCAFGTGAVLAVGVIGGLGYYIYQSKKAQQPSHPQQNSHPKQPPQTNKFEMD